MAGTDELTKLTEAVEELSSIVASLDSASVADQVVTIIQPTLNGMLASISRLEAAVTGSPALAVAPLAAPQPPQPTLEGRMLEVFTGCDSSKFLTVVDAENFLENSFTGMHHQFPDATFDGFVEAAQDAVVQANLGSVFSSRMVRATAAEVFESPEMSAPKPAKGKRRGGISFRGRTPRGE